MTNWLLFRDLSEMKYFSREEIKRLEDEIARSKFTMDALQSRILDLKSRAKEAARAQEEIVNLKKKIDGLEKTSMVLTASKEEVQDMIKRNNDYDTLCLLVTTLKKYFCKKKFVQFDATF